MIHGQVGQEGLDFRNAHVLGMSFAVIENVAFDPADVGFFRADGVVLAADRVADTSTSSVQA